MAEEKPKKGAAKKASASAKPVELSVSYSMGVTVNLGNYESGRADIIRAEKWDVTGMTPTEVTELYEERLKLLKEEVTPLIEQEYDEMKPTKGRR